MSGDSWSNGQAIALILVAFFVAVIALSILGEFVNIW